MGILDKLKGYKQKAENWNEQRNVKAEQDRTVRLEKRKKDVAWRKQELSVREDEDRLNRREARLNNPRSSGGSSISFNPNGGGSLLDMGMSGGSYMGSNSGFDIFSTDMGSGGSLFETGLAPRKKHRRANKKTKTTKRKR
jgi:hypothetical protein